MNLFFKNLSLVAIAAVASLPVSAIPTLKLTDDLGNSITLTDGDADGVVSYNTLADGALTGGSSASLWTVNINGGITKPFSGSTSEPFMGLVGLNSASGAGSLIIEFFEDGFTQTPFQARVANTAINPLGGDGSGSTLETFYNAVLYSTFSNNAPGADSLNVLGAAVTPGTNPYSLTLKTTLVAGASGGLFTSDLQLTGVPEPGFYGALAVGLSGLFVAVARRRRAAVAE